MGHGFDGRYCQTPDDGCTPLSSGSAGCAVPCISGSVCGVRGGADAGLARRSCDTVPGGWRDGPGERTGTVPALQSREGRKAPVSFTPRPWQSAFLSAHTAVANAPDFLLVATPGAGKTLAACEAARLADC